MSLENVGQRGHPFAEGELSLTEVFDGFGQVGGGHLRLFAGGVEVKLALVDLEFYFFFRLIQLQTGDLGVGPGDLHLVSPFVPAEDGYMMEDLVLKLTELDIDTCWMTFTDSDKIKKALSLTTPLEVAAIVAFGYGEKTAKKLRLNILSMSQIDVRAEQQYYAPKKGVHDLVHMGSWSNKSGLDEMMDFYDDMLWQSFYAASLSPSYLNRQPYGFLVQDHSIYLVQQEDAYTDNLDAALDLGIVMLHFSAVASQWAGQVRWELSPAAPDGLPEGLRSAAVYHM